MFAQGRANKKGVISENSSLLQDVSPEDKDILINGVNFRKTKEGARPQQKQTTKH